MSVVPFRKPGAGPGKDSLPPTGTPPPPKRYGDWRDHLVWTANSKSETMDETVVNAIVFFRFHPAWKDVIAYNELTQTIETRKSPPWSASEAGADSKPGPWSDVDTTRAQSSLRRLLSIDLGEGPTLRAIAVAADANAFNPVVEYLESLPYDSNGPGLVGRPATPGDPGAVGWMHRYMHAEDSTYARMIGRYQAVASCARAYDPGCKVDTVTIAEAREGKKKSQFSKAMYSPQWFSDTPIDLRSKDRFDAMKGIWCLELAEFEQYNAHEAAVLMAFASSGTDKYRASYGRFDTWNPRRLIWTATVNPGKQYFNREGAGRRWQPYRTNINGRDCDVDGFLRDRDRFWAEAREIYKFGVATKNEACRWWPETEAEKQMCWEQVEERQTQDIWFSRVADWLAGKPADAIVKPEDVLGSTLQIDVKDWTDKNSQRVQRILRECGWERHKDSRETLDPDGVKRRKTHYRKPPACAAQGQT